MVQQYLILNGFEAEVTGYSTSLEDAERVISFLFNKELNTTFQRLNSVEIGGRDSRNGYRVAVKIRYQEDADLECGGYEAEEIWYLQELKTIEDLEMEGL